MIKQHIDSEEVAIEHTPTENMLADLLTKALRGKPFWRLLSEVTGQPRKKKVRFEDDAD